MIDRFPLLCWPLGLFLATTASCMPKEGGLGGGPGSGSLDTTLKEAYEDAFLVGVALKRHQMMDEDWVHRETALRHFNSVTAENEMKWDHLSEEPGVFDFRAADALVQMGEEHGLAVIGHTLVWHNQVPASVFVDEDGETVSREVLMERMRRHIFTVVGRYRGKVHGWDVLNEALNEDGTLRQTQWLEIIGPEYIELAFRWAGEADPEAELYYNDYNLFRETKCRAAVDLALSLREKGLRIDAIGLQGHYMLGFPDLEDVERSLKMIGEAGFQAMVTELDISVLRFPDAEERGADITLNYELQEALNPYAEGLPETVSEELADRYEELFQLFLDHRETVSRVTLWGLTDADSWKNNWPMRGRTDYPLLFDRQGQPKEALRRVLELP